MKAWTLLFPVVACTGCQLGHEHSQTSSDPSQWYTYEQITEPAVLEDDGKPLYVERRVSRIDIDLDGKPETVVTDPISGGNAGIDHSIYREHDGQYELIGTLFFHPLAIRVLEPTDEYPIRVIRYWRSNASEGSLDTLGYKDGQFIILSSETIHPGDGGTDEGRQRYAQVFGE